MRDMRASIMRVLAQREALMAGVFVGILLALVTQGVILGVTI